MVEADDLYETKSSESSEEVVGADVAVDPALSTVAWEELELEVALDLLRMALYSSLVLRVALLAVKDLPGV